MMKFLVYLPYDEQVVSCDPEDYLSDQTLNPHSLDELDGKLVEGVCYHDGEVYNYAILLQICEEDYVDRKLTFLRHVLLKKAKSPEKLKPLITFNALSAKRPTLNPFKIKVEPEAETPNQKRPSSTYREITFESNDCDDYTPPLRKKRVSSMMDPESPQILKVEEIKEITFKSDTLSRIEEEIRREGMVVQDEEISTFQPGTTSTFQPGTNDPETSLIESVLRNEKRLEAMCRRANIEPDSFQGIRFTQAFTLTHISDLSARLASMEKFPSRGSRPTVRLAKEPLFETRAEVKSLSHLDEQTKDWMDSVGGHSAKDHVHRVLKGLLSHSLQLQINRTGGFGKIKFPIVVEDALCSSTRKLFPLETRASVEKLCVRFFKNAADRAGGRNSRKDRRLMTVSGRKDQPDGVE